MLFQQILSIIGEHSFVLRMREDLNVVGEGFLFFLFCESDSIDAGHLTILTCRSWSMGWLYKRLALGFTGLVMLWFITSYVKD